MNWPNVVLLEYKNGTWRANLSFCCTRLSLSLSTVSVVVHHIREHLSSSPCMIFMSIKT